MKKTLLWLLLIAIIASSAVTSVFAGHATDKQNEIIYYVWNNGADAGDNKSGDEPLNQLELDYGEIDGVSGVKMTYVSNGAVKDPYYSLTKIDFNEYKYCSIKYYIYTENESSTTGASFYVRYNGGSGYANIGNVHNKWTVSVISFKTEDGSTCEWPDKASGTTWFRVNCRLEENENMYIKWIAFFKTQSEAEDFNGFCDFSAYESAYKAASAVRRQEYKDCSALDKALAVDVSGYVFASDQSKIDAATKGINDALAALEKTEGKPAGYIEPEVKIIPVIFEEATVPEASETEAEIIQTETEAGAQTAAQTEAPADGGCKSSVCGIALLISLLGAAVTLKRRNQQ